MAISQASATRTWLGALSLAVAGLLFILYPVLRPWRDETTVTGAIDAMSSSAWIASHLSAMIGFILVGLGLLALWGTVHATRAEPTALAAVITSWLGAGLTLPYYGAEAFGLYAIASRAAAGEPAVVRAEEMKTMTRDKDRKRIIRKRMEKTGESYTAARAQLLSIASSRKN
jgi:hypothetical protein